MKRKDFLKIAATMGVVSLLPIPSIPIWQYDMRKNIKLNPKIMDGFDLHLDEHGNLIPIDGIQYMTKSVANIVNGMSSPVEMIQVKRKKHSLCNV